MRLTEKGQVTIPVAIREQLGLRAGDDLDFVVEDGGVRLVRSRSARSRGRRLVDQLRGRGDVMMGTDDIMALTRDS